jgi:hypothetical protein
LGRRKHEDDKESDHFMDDNEFKQEVEMACESLEIAVMRMILVVTRDNNPKKTKQHSTSECSS